MNKTGIIIEGGAMRSVFAAGVLDNFMDHNIEIPNVLAVSAGAYAGMNYVSGQKGRILDAVIRPLAKEKYLGAGTFLRKGTFFDMDYLFEKVPKTDAPFDFDTFKNSAKHFITSTMNCITGESNYYENFEDEEQFWNVCRAANSMPFISKITEINGIPMLDGGMSDAIPISKAMEEDWKKLVIILTRRTEYKKKNRHFYMMLLRIVYRKYPEVIKTVQGRSAKYNACLETVSRLEKEGKALVLRPTRIAVKNQESNINTLMDYYNHGYEEAEKRSEKIAQFLLA